MGLGEKWTPGSIFHSITWNSLRPQCGKMGHPPPHYFMSPISYHYQYLSKFMRVVQIACHDICPTLTPPSDPALCDAKPQPSQKSLDKSYINFQKVKYKRSKDLGALVDSCSWDDIGNFLHTCIKHSLLQTKSIEIWVNSHM